jgi:tetratricopeptide (TPR) repeat protein
MAVMNTKTVRTTLVLVFVALGAALAASDAFAEGQGKPVDSIADVPRKARLALFQAYEVRGEGDYQQSSKILLDFLERNPDDDHFLIRYHLGNSMSQTHTMEDQLEQYQRCVELEPRFDKGWMSLGEVAYNLGEYALAAEALSNGFHLGSEKKPQVLYYAAAAYVMAEQPGDAVPVLEELVSGKWGAPKMDYYKALVSAALQMEDTGTGDRAVQRMLDTYSDDPDAWTLAFQYAAGTGDYRQAAVALKVKSYLVPLTREEQIQLGDLYSLIEVPREASVNYETAMGGDAETKELERLASAYLAAHDTEAAMRTLNRALEREPTARLWSLYGDLNFMGKKYEDAYRAYQKSAEIDPEEGRAYLMMAYCAMEIGDKDDVMTQLELAADYPEQETKAREILSKIDVYFPSP